MATRMRLASAARHDLRRRPRRRQSAQHLGTDRHDPPPLQPAADDGVVELLVAAVGTHRGAEETGADENAIHGCFPMRSVRVARKTSRRKKSSVAMRASIAAMNSPPTILLIGSSLKALMKSDAK